ncbi:probable 3-beta-hydroxysteroid-Delta(8),Delta(7)-isomerase [Aristolochia californica]|uniref:probable 3-beta-hydroxysteroid-Delta(8),Delta(7)-isomerase n=1 Tax=Aristolochia californica TaxID=171875 RepID=UPI0035E0E8B7
MTILSVYIGVSVVIILLTWTSSGRCAKISKIDRLLMCWFIFTGLTHIILEGYFAFSPEFYKEKTPHYLAEVCKEYSKGDSRYAARDAGVVTVEGITAALEGSSSAREPARFKATPTYSYNLPLAISLVQLYGDAVYYITSYLEGDNFSTNPFYYWA